MADDGERGTGHLAHLEVLVGKLVAIDAAEEQSYVEQEVEWQKT